MEKEELGRPKTTNHARIPMRAYTHTSEHILTCAGPSSPAAPCLPPPAESASLADALETSVSLLHARVTALTAIRRQTGATGSPAHSRVVCNDISLRAYLPDRAPTYNSVTPTRFLSERVGYRKLGATFLASPVRGEKLHQGPRPRPGD